jgi:rsbT co-antagonist protein RsbR
VEIIFMDADTTTRFAAVLQANREALVKHWRTAIAAKLRGRQTEVELSGQIEDLHSSLLAAASDGPLDLASPAAAELRAVLTEVSARRAKVGFAPTETTAAVFALKDALFATMDSDDTGQLRDYLEFAAFVDEMGVYTFETYAKAREALITDQSEQLLEISTPVVKLWDGVMAVPLVGTLDSARAQVVMERLLQALADTSSPFAIIDITGVPAVDTQVAQHILKTIVAARLMGADCIISGIRPQIAQTIVALGIEFSDIVTKASLADALTHVLRTSGIDLVRRPQRAG